MNQGDYYFIYGNSYDREKMRQAVLNLDYIEELEGGPLSTPKYVRGENIINLTSWEEGKIQIKLYYGNVKENLLELMGALEPDCLVNTVCLEVALD